MAYEDKATACLEIAGCEESSDIQQHRMVLRAILGSRDLTRTFGTISVP